MLVTMGPVFYWLEHVIQAQFRRGIKFQWCKFITLLFPYYFFVLHVIPLIIEGWNTQSHWN